MSDNYAGHGDPPKPVGMRAERPPTPDQQDSRFREMVRQSPFSMMIFGPSGRVLEVNPAFEEMWGVSASAVAGYNPFENEQSHAHGMVPFLERAFAGETVVMPEAPYDAALTASGGRRRWIRTFAYPVKDEAGRVSQVVFMHEDVTARREAEEKLRYQLHLTETITSRAGEALFLMDSAGRVTFMNPAAEEMFGWGQAELQGKALHDVIHYQRPDSTPFPLAECTLGRVMTSGESVRGHEDVFYARGGRPVLVRCSNAPVFEGGRIAGAVLAVSDITANRRAEQELRESEGRLRQMADAMPQIVWVTRPDGYHEYYNQKWYEYVGLDYERTKGHHWADPLHPEDRARARERWALALSTGEPYEIEYRFRRHDGAYRWFLGRALPVRDEAGEIVKWFGTCTDIDDAKRADEERARLLANEQASRARAEEANRLKDEFLATGSHELRTPLTAIAGWAHMLGEGGLDPDTARRAVSVIRRNAEQQQQLIEDILDVSRIITGKLKLESQRLDVASVVGSALDTVRPAAEAKSIQLRSDFGRGAEVVGDPRRLQQVVWNLLANAVKFTPPGGEVRVSAERLLRHVRIEVSDTGQGIMQEFLPYVFDRFRQADGSTSRQHGGLGLGLSIVRHLVEAHGGSVHAYSAGEGQGATFTVDLPLRASAEAAEPKAQDGAQTRHEESPEHDASDPKGGGDEAAPLMGLRVLAVDDNPDTLEMLATLLVNKGAEVRAESSAGGALGALAEMLPDVIVADIAMPGEDGYVFMRRARALGAGRGGWTPAIALTAHAGEADRARALRAGYQVHLAKPIDSEALVETLTKLAGTVGRR